MTCTMNEIARTSFSEARARLPELAQLAMESPGSIVIIEHRDYKERLALTTEGYVQLLEETIMELQAQLGLPAFKLEGSLQTDLTPEEMEAELMALRAEQAQSGAARFLVPEE
jgi:hypothetical protein